MKTADMRLVQTVTQTFVEAQGFLFPFFPPFSTQNAAWYS